MMHWVLLIAGLLELLAIIVLAAITAATVKKPIFFVIQLISVNLTPIGWLVCLSPALARASWIFWNDDLEPNGWQWWAAYKWLAWRNPVDNFKHVKWTQAPGPLVYRSWFWRGKQFYYKAGWMSDSFCCLSGGGGRGY